jgi:hypothetical protein
VSGDIDFLGAVVGRVSANTRRRVRAAVSAAALSGRSLKSEMEAQ